MPEAPIAAPAAPVSAPAPSAPAAEVVIDQNPVSTPQPVGSQAPEKPTGEVKGSEHRPATRRESIQRAFDKANADAAKVAKEPATAKATARLTTKKPVAGKPQTEEQQGGLDLRKSPAREPYREGGRFARPPAEPAADDKGQPVGTQPQQTAPAKPAAPLPETAPYREPPPRFSERGKAEWATAPESVRGEVYRMAQEFDGAYKKYRSDNETMNTIRPFHELATKHGTTLERALTNYVGMEQKLRSDVIGGLDVIISNLNLRTSDGKKLTLPDIAHYVLTQSPEQHRLVQNQNATQAASHQIGELHQTVSTLAQTVQQMQHGMQFGQTRSAVDQFAETHPRFDELGDLIEQELRYGFSLEQAYQRAELLRPASTRAAQPGNNPPAQTRSDKSIHGAPESGPSDGPPSRRKGDKPVGRREAIERAIQRVNGRV